MYESVKHGSILDIESLDTLSDGTAGGVEQGSVRKCDLSILIIFLKENSHFIEVQFRSVSLLKILA